MNDVTASAQLPFRVLLRVRYAECDAQQVVFNARYGDYADVAMTEYFRALFGSYQALLAQGVDCQVVRMDTHWRAPARFDDVLVLAVSTARLGTTSFTLRVEFSQFASGAAIAGTELTYVLVDTAHHAKTPLPDWLRQRLLAGAPARSVDLAGVAAGPGPA